jgi:zinc protease
MVTKGSRNEMMKSLSTPFSLLGAFFLLVSCASFVSASPDIKTWKTKNGARVLYVYSPQLPMVDVRISFYAGGARDGRKSGLSALTNRMMSMGAGNLSAGQLAEKFESVGAQQGNGVARDSAWVSLRSLTDKKLLDKAVKHTALILTKPTFKQGDLDRERKRTLIALKHQEQSPSAIAKRAFYKNLYAGHPYQNLPIGTVDSVKEITREDLIRFHKQYYVGNNAVVAVVGAVKEAQARKLIEDIIGNLPKGKRAVKLPPVPELKAGKTIRIKHPSKQTHIYMGRPGVYRGAPDYFQTYVGNHRLGGSGLVSLLGEEVREKRGLSYSVYSYFYPMQRRGPFMIVMQTKNAQAEKGLKVLRETVDAYLKRGMNKEEFKASRQNITGGFALRIDNNGKIVEYLSMIGFYELPTTYLRDFNKTVNALKLNDVNSAMRKHVKTDKMITVIVGDS